MVRSITPSMKTLSCFFFLLLAVVAFAQLSPMGSTNQLQVSVHQADKGAAKELVEVVVGIATLATLLYGLYTAIRKFGWTREECTFLRLELDAKVIQGVHDLVLVTVTVRLENKGQTRISARRSKNLPYNDGFDLCNFPGTLKIRALKECTHASVFDWYSLGPFTVVSTNAEGKQESEELEQINYLDEFQDPRSKFKESDFWLEPNECVESQVPVWLKPGAYAVKAFFLGTETKPGEEEYWSATKFFHLRPDESQATKSQPSKAS